MNTKSSKLKRLTNFVPCHCTMPSFHFSFPFPQECLNDFVDRLEGSFWNNQSNQMIYGDGSQYSLEKNEPSSWVHKRSLPTRKSIGKLIKERLYLSFG